MFSVFWWNKQLKIKFSKKFDLLKKIANVTLSKKYAQKYFFLKSKNVQLKNKEFRKLLCFQKNIFLSILFGKCYIGYFFQQIKFFWKLDFELLISPKNTKQYYMLLRWYETHFYIVCYTLYKFIATNKSIEPHWKIQTYIFI